jgi:regulator of nucleoside diphosphate kinase
MPGENMINRREMSSQQTICVTRFDMECLRALITRMYWMRAETGSLVRLQEVLDSAEVVNTTDLSAQRVTLDSQVRLKNLDSRKEHVFTIVLPLQADIDRHKISVLSPLGTALLGHKVGDIIDVEAPSGIREFSIEEVLHQPETERLHPARKAKRSSSGARRT